MKSLPVITVGVFACLFGLAVPRTTAGAGEQKMYEEAVRDYMAGRVDQAETKFEMMLQQDPKNARAKNYLTMIRTGKRAKGGSIEGQLAAIKLPKVEFTDATFNSALDFVRHEVARQSENKTTINFVLQVPNELKEKPITLSLREIPVTELLKYMGQLAGVEFKFEAHAVVVKPATAAVATPEQS